jgi:serine/threonine-protein kinase
MLVQAGQMLAHYRLVEKIGEGGFGEVWRSQDTHLGDRNVAVKVLRSGLVSDDAVRGRFRREALALSELNHPNIATVHDFDTQDGVDFIVMEYVDGPTLKDRLKEGPLPEEEVLQLGAQIAEGLSSAHCKGILHRDLKPANIRITTEGILKILDFGLAKILRPRIDPEKTETLTLGLVGTPAYMAPEQARQQSVDPRTDVYAAGTLLYEMATGKHPFASSDPKQLFENIASAEPTSPRAIRRELSVGLEVVVSTAMAKDPIQRYASGTLLLEALERVRAGRRPQKWPAPRQVLILAIVATLIVTTWLVVASIQGRWPFASAGGEPIRSIAVLPLENLTGDKDKEYFVDGVTDELIGHLGQIGALRVISRQSAMRYRDSDKLLPEIAEELNVDAVVVGSVQRAGESVRIRVQLIDVLPEERILWGQMYENPMAEILAVYNEVARAIVSEVQIALTPNEETRLASARLVDAEAYEAYLKGMSHAFKLTPPELDAAQHYFERALDTDPDYALAYAGISFIWVARQQMGLLIPSEATPRAKEAAQKALELDDTLSEVHGTWASIKTWSDWDWEGGEQSFKRALELNPNNAEALVYYSNLLCYMDRLDEAMEMAERAVQLDPLNSITLTISACTLSYLQRYDDAIERYQFALGTSPNDPVAHNGLWEIYHAKGMYEESLESAKAFFTGLGFAEIAEVMAHGYEEGGYSWAMRSAAETMEAFSKQTYVSPDAIARMYAFAGDKEKTIEWLEMGYEMRDPMMPYVGAFTYDLLDGDPRYQDLLRRMNLPDGN